MKPWPTGSGQPVPGLLAAILLLSAAQAASPEHTGDAVWLIRFDEPGLLQAQAGRTLPLDRHDPGALVANRQHLMASQASRIAAINQRLGRNPDITHHYLASHSGIAIRLRPGEDEYLRAMPGVTSVRPEPIETLTTFRSPWFIGADQIWSGQAAPDGLPHRGNGLVVAVIDTGIDPTHPAFADDPACGHGTDGTPSKLISHLDCMQTDEAGRCNGWDPDDALGHGTHVAGTAAGNAVPSDQPGMDTSGVAPCAHLRSYKACNANTCSGAALQAAMDNILVDGDVDVLNYSISGGLEPWVDLDRTKLDLVASGVLVAASAGNTQPVPGLDNPVGRVNHLGPWVTTVAASTHDVWADALLNAGSGGTPAPGLASVRIFKASDSPNVDAHSQLPARHFDQQPSQYEGCTPGQAGAPADMPPIPSGYFSGAAALIAGSGCSPQTRIQNVLDAGAELVLLRADGVDDLPDLDTHDQPAVPAYGLAAAPGQALAALLAEQPNSVVLDIQPVLGDALADFSLRGPTPTRFSALTKPDVTAPGVRIYAPDVSPDRFDYLDGTSMASPHVAGAAALIRGMHPQWTPAEITAALMMTAAVEGLHDTWDRPWDWDGVGSGRIDLSRVAAAGLLVDETVDRYLAADPDNGELPLQEINRPSIRDTRCSPHCVWSRELRSVLPGDSRWVVGVESLTPGLDIRVWPPQFIISGDPNPEADPIFTDRFADTADPMRDTHRIAVSARPPTGGGLAHGRIILTELDGRSPPLHLTVSVAGDPHHPDSRALEVAPRTIWTHGGDGPTHVRLTLWNHSDSILNWQRANAAADGVLWSQPPNGDDGILSSYSTTQNGGLYTANDFQLSRRMLLTRIIVPGTDHGDSLAAQPAITWMIFPDQGGQPAGNPQTHPGAALWTHSAPPDSPGTSVEGDELRLDLAAAGQVVDLPAGHYWLSVFPSYDNNVTGTGPRWTWRQATSSGQGARLISPTLFNLTSWAPITTFGVQFTDTAFTLEGRPGGALICGAPWIELSVSKGEIAADQTQEVTVTLDPAGLTEGSHSAHLCLNTDHPATRAVVIPVYLQVHSG